MVSSPPRDHIRLKIRLKLSSSTIKLTHQPPPPPTHVFMIKVKITLYSLHCDVHILQINEMSRLCPRAVSKMYRPVQDKQKVAVLK